MEAVLVSLQKRKLKYRIFTSIREFLVDSRAIGIILIACILLSLTLSNLPATKLKIASLPSHAKLWGIGILGGIGFTMSIFTFTPAYNTEALQVISKISIISASVIAAIAGYTWFRRVIPAALITINAYKEIAESGQKEKDISLAIS